MSINFLQPTGRGHCFICHKTFGINEEDIEQHLMGHHEKGETQTKCNNCDYPHLVISNPC